MPTKLKKPITVTITHVENAIWVSLQVRGECDDKSPRHNMLRELSNGSHGQNIRDQLSAQGIDYRTWEPPQPIYIAGCEADFKSNGNVKLGSETLDRATLLEVLKRSDQAMQKVEEWPRFWQNTTTKVVYKASGAECIGLYFDSDKMDWVNSWGAPLAQCAERHPYGWKQIPRAEACAILGRDV